MGSVIDKARIISACGKVPLLGSSLRRIARRYAEGSVVSIKNGHLAGYQWKRSHRYVSGYWLGIYELSIQDCLVRELKPGDVFYDIGANAGFFTLLGSKCVGPEGRVFSFEPLPENVQSVRAQVELNRVANCVVVEAAVSDHGGRVRLSEGRDASTAHITRADGGEVDTSAMSVRSVRLDDFVATAAAPDLIKMDIEGAEVDALQGARELLSGQAPPKLLIEFHSDRLKRDGCAMLRDLGYAFRSVQGALCGSDTLPIERHVLCLPRHGRHAGDTSRS